MYYMEILTAITIRLQLYERHKYLTFRNIYLSVLTFSVRTFAWCFRRTFVDDKLCH